MLSMARVMVAEPRVVLIDEPSEGLAPMIVVEVFAIIREMRESRNYRPAGGAKRPRGDFALRQIHGAGTRSGDPDGRGRR